jgi:hypothetical protein
VTAYGERLEEAVAALRVAMDSWLKLDPLCGQGPLVVGEAPNSSGCGRRRNQIFMGGKLIKLDGGRLERTNLLWEWPGASGRGSHFPKAEGAAAADDLLGDLGQLGRTGRGLILVGTRVATAFGLKRSDYEWLTWIEYRKHPMAVMPHTSGLVTWWNDADNRARAQAFFNVALAYTLELP